jgi:bifunctional UDP-N-acetylglucosamine pyrophosphorylase/glucosamine-1-phosphate N-acetyltransferase
MTDRSLACLILAGGLGTRMRSSLPKVLHPACGRPLLEWVLDAVSPLGAAPTVVVVPPDAPQIAELLPESVTAVVQRQPRGTGDAVRCAADALSGFGGDVLVVYADTALLEPEPLTELLAARRSAGAAAAVLTIERDRRTGADFGRVVRGADGSVQRIVELRDASIAERELTEVNSGIYAFDAAQLWRSLGRLTADNDQGELYLTDVIGLLVEAGETVVVHRHPDATIAHGINTRVDLAEATVVLRERINRRHMLAGVTIVDPASTFIEAHVTIEPDAQIQPFTVLRGATAVGRGAVVGPHAVVVDSEVGEEALVGPFCYLRPGTRLGPRAKAGTFVEMKNSSLGEGAKVPHLSYIGDAEIGQGSNIGAGAITANYDGRSKNRTIIGRDVRTSCDNVFVAPVTIGDGAWTGAGSTITDDIPPEALGIARAKQTNIEGYARRRRR